MSTIKINTRTILQKLRKYILARTQSGKDTYNQAFLPYTPQYAKKKGTKKVNLRLTGHMLNDLKAINDDTMGLTNPYAIAKAKGNANHGRQFMGNITPQQTRIIQQQVHKQVQNEMRKITSNWKLK